MNFTDVYRAHYPDVLAFLRRRVPVEHAEDLVADVFTRAWRNFGQLQGQPLPWLYGIARNVLREFYRSSRPAHDNVDDIDPGRADFAASVDLSLDINRALLTLSPTDREILTLHAWEGLTPAELAAALELTPVNVRVRLHRARTRLAEALESSQEQP